MRGAALLASAAAGANVTRPMADCQGSITARAGTHRCEHQSVTFNYHVPEVCETAGGCGVVFDVHGLVMSGEINERNTRMRSRGDRYGYIIVQPTAPPGVPPLTSWSSANDAAVYAVLEMLLAVDAWRVDRGKIHMTGFSQGGAMSWRFFCKHADVFASIAPGAMNGGGQNSCFGTSQEIPLLYWHGTNDAIVSFRGSVATREAMEAAWRPGAATVLSEDAHHRWERRVSAQGTTWEFLEYDYEAGVAVRSHCFPGGGETSPGPGSVIAFSCPLPSPQESAFDIGEAVMQFFIAHPKGRRGPPAHTKTHVRGAFLDAPTETTLAERLAAADAAGAAVVARGPRHRAAAAPRNASAGRRCANALTPGSHEHSLTVGGSTRVFRYFVPAGLSASQEVPMIIFFHGYGGNGAGFERSTNANSHAERHQWLTLHPSGGLANGWNAGGCCPLSESDDLSFTDAMLAWAEENMCVGKKFASGFSNGGFFSNRLACERGHVFTGIAPLAGPLAFSPSLSGPLTHPFNSPCTPGTGNHPTVLHMHGTSDGTVSYTGNALFGWPSATASCESWAEINRCTGSREEGQSRVWTGCAGGSSVELVTYQGGGHSYFSDVTDRVFEKFLPLA